MDFKNDTEKLIKTVFCRLLINYENINIIVAV